MSLTSIGDQKTPGRPIELTFGAQLGTPSDNQELLLIGEKGSASGLQDAYEVVQVNNVASVEAASGEVATKFGDGSKISKMVLAAVRANEGRGTFPAIKVVPLENGDTDFGSSDEALTAAKAVKAEFLVSQFDGQSEQSLVQKLVDAANVMSGPQRVENDQYGTFAVAANFSESDPANLHSYDSQYFAGVYLRDSDNPNYSVGELAAAYAALNAANNAPFNPLDDEELQGVNAPNKRSDYLTVGAGLESESTLNQGWTPLKVAPNGSVRVVRTVTGRLTVGGSGVTDVTAYYDIQDFQVLYFWRKTLFARFTQPDFKQRKASVDTAGEVLNEMIRLANLFETQNMFQAVEQLAKQFQVERSTSDRHRFDYFTPVNVIPGLHVLAGNIEASTQFDVLSI